MSHPLPQPGFTPKQGQYLAFIYAYTRLHRRPPAEADMQQYFRVSPPSVHQMVLTLERAGFIQRQPGVARSIEMLVDPEHLPVLRQSYDDPRFNRSKPLCRSTRAISGAWRGILAGSSPRRPIALWPTGK